jgi:hypothetical protein
MQVLVAALDASLRESSLAELDEELYGTFGYADVC